MNYYRVILFFLSLMSTIDAQQKNDTSGQSLSDYILSPFQFLLASASKEENNDTKPIITEKTSSAAASTKKEPPFAPTQTGPKNTVIEKQNSESQSEESETDKAVLEYAEEDEQSIELHLENADLSILVSQIAEIFGRKFLTDDMIDPLPADGRSVKGNKITFKTHHPLSKNEVWNIFLSLMEMAKFAVVPQEEFGVYRITSQDKAKHGPLNTFIGVSASALPENDELIRYVYFVENTNLDTLKPIIDSLRSPASDFLLLKSSRAFMLTDRAYNIRVLMKIVEELDKAIMPETLSVLKLRNADAKQVAELLQKLLPKDEGGRGGTKRQPTALYFPENVRVIPDLRTNTLILLGSRDTVAKIEEFIKQHVDVTLDQPYAPFFVHQLKYADAETIAEIMNNVTQFGKDSDAGKTGGVRGNDQYLGPIFFVAEKETNRLIIKGHYEDYLRALEVIDKLDEAQPQIALEILVVSIAVTDRMSLGAQLRSKQPGPGIFGTDVNFQTSGLFGTSGLQLNTGSSGQPLPGVDSILGNLINLVVGATPGNTIISLGRDAFGVWGILQILKTLTNVEVVANPFFTVTNKTPATVFLGEERRVVTAIVSGVETVQSQGKDQAKLEVNATPQINSDGKVLLQLHITDNDFTDTTDFTSGTKTIREIQTNIIMADGDIAAVGGVLRDQITMTMTKVPILGDLPFIGWFFRNQQKLILKNQLLVLIGVDIVGVNQKEKMRGVTNRHLAGYYGMLDSMESSSNKKDPIHKAFFKEDKTEKLIEELIFKRHKEPTRDKRMRMSSRTQKKNASRAA
jgi:general secretion pathway protein D